MAEPLNIQEYEVTGFDEAKAPKSVKVFSTDAKTAQIIAQSKHKMSAKSATLINPSKKGDISKHTVPPTKQLGVNHDAIPNVKK